MSETVDMLDDPTRHVTENLCCAGCGAVMGSISGPAGGVQRELEHYKTSKVKCSECQAPVKKTKKLKGRGRK